MLISLTALLTLATGWTLSHFATSTPGRGDSAGGPPAEPVPPSIPPSMPVMAPPTVPSPLIDEPVEAVVDAQGQLAEDVDCRKCGYNLRGLGLELSCPECGTPVGRSIMGDRLRFSDPAWVDRLARGLGLVILGLLASILVTVLGWVVRVAAGSATMNSAGAALSAVELTTFGVTVMTTACQAVLALGVWLATTPDPGRIATERRLCARVLARWGYLAALLATPMNSLGFNFAGAGAGGMTLPTTYTTVMAWAGTLLSGAVLIGVVAGFSHLRALTVRVPAHAVATQCRIVMWGLGFSQGLGLILAVIMLLAMNAFMMAFAGQGAGGRGPSPGTMSAMRLLGTGTCAIWLGTMIFGIWGIVLLFIARSRFRTAAAQARATWAAGMWPTEALDSGTA